MEVQDTPTANPAVHPPGLERSGAAGPQVSDLDSEPLSEAKTRDATRRPQPSDPDAGALEYDSWRVQ